VIEIAREVVHDRSAAERDHPFLFESAGNSIVGEWDAGRLYQVIDNLVGNAVKYTPAGGKITVRADTDGITGDALITVSDEGRGILPEEQQHIFSAFYRTREAASSQIAGLGLGLYICNELVVAHGGSVEVGNSEAGGAAFTIRLPRAVRAAAA
jgi:signal transduction histidine kinase